MPRGWLPLPGQRKALAYLYPDEDRRLLACAAVPLVYRLLYGFLAREGLSFAMLRVMPDAAQAEVPEDEAVERERETETRARTGVSG